MSESYIFYGFCCEYKIIRVINKYTISCFEFSREAITYNSSLCNNCKTIAIKIYGPKANVVGFRENVKGTLQSQ